MSFSSYGRVFVTLVAVFLVCEALPISAQDSNSHCHNFPVTPGYGFRYMDRGEPVDNTDRCEGVVGDKLSPSLPLVSFTHIFEEFNSTEDLIIMWEGSESLPVHLAAVNLHPHFSYYMNTTRAADNISFRWTKIILSILKITQDNLGVRGWVERPDGRKVYLPLRIVEEGQAIQSEKYTLVLRPEYDLNEVYVTLATVDVDDDWKEKDFLRDEVALGLGPYIAKSPIRAEIQFAELQEAGFYYVEVLAEIKTGGDMITKFWFYHLGSQ